MLSKIFFVFIIDLFLVDCRFSVPFELNSFGELPERGESQRSFFPLKTFVPIAFFCHFDECSIDLRSYSSDFVGILTFDGNLEKNYQIRTRKNELMFVLLLNISSSFARGIFFERRIYWQRMTDSVDLAPSISTTLLVSSQLIIETNYSNSFVNIHRFRPFSSFLLSLYDRSISDDKTENNDEFFYFPSASVRQTVGIYQLVEEYSIRSENLLKTFLQIEQSKIRCQTIKRKTFESNSCGTLTVFPSMRLFTDQFQSQIIYHCSNGTTTDFKLCSNFEKTTKDLSIIFTSYFLVVGLVFGIGILYYTLISTVRCLRRLGNATETFDNEIRKESESSSDDD